MIKLSDIHMCSLQLSNQNCTSTHAVAQGGIKYFALWQFTVFINNFLRDITNRIISNDPQLTFNVKKGFFLP